MSVLVECYSVIVRRSAIESRYPGGMGAYEVDCPNQTLCADENLVRVGFMVLDDLNEFLLRVLGRAGLASTPSGVPDLRIDPDGVAIVEQGRGPWHPEYECKWLRYAERPDGVCLCWLAEHPEGDLGVPLGGSRRAPITAPPSPSWRTRWRGSWCPQGRHCRRPRPATSECSGASGIPPRASRRSRAPRKWGNSLGQTHPVSFRRWSAV